NTGAYMAEIIRAGIQSVDSGQSEAASSLGMNNLQTMLFIVLPQAIRNALPAIGNEFVVNIKDTSVLNVISVTELYFQSSSVAGMHYRYFETYLITALCYFVMTFTTTRILNYIEKRLDQPKTSFPASQTMPHTMGLEK
ncbi:MAG: amino acid ABC transporter permease, partial [Erysipelotrichaceae bacterium]